MLSITRTRLLAAFTIVATTGAFALNPALAGAGAKGHSHGHDTTQTTGNENAKGHTDGHGHAHGHGTAAEIGQPADEADASRKVQVTMHDNYYEPARINVMPGEIVHFTVRNEGEFVHEFNIATSALHAAHQKEMQAMMESGALTASGLNHEMMNDANGHGMSHDDPNSVLLEPGETAELTWKFPMTAELEFACNVPGHYESGMVGNIRFHQVEGS